MTVYADTNFLTRLYLERPESLEAESLSKGWSSPLPVTWLLRLELINAFEQAVLSGYGKAQTRITREIAAACQQLFREDLEAGVALCLVDLPMVALTRCFEEISLRHTARHGFRTYDILHVASGLVMGCTSFWSFDERALRLAKLEGLQVIRGKKVGEEER